MSIYLPIAELSVSLPALLVIGTLVGILSGLFGIGGGFLATPMLLHIGIPVPVAVTNQSCLLMASSTTGTMTHLKHGRCDIRLALALFAGSLPGIALGTLAMRALTHVGYSDLIISLVYIVLLTGVGGMMLADGIRHFKPHAPAGTNDTTNPATPLIKKMPSALLVPVHFHKSDITVPVALPLLIGLVSGVLVSLLGIGAGFLLVPALIYILKVPGRLVSGTSLFQIGLTTAASAVTAALTTNRLDLFLSVPLMLGAVLGTSLGLRLNRFVPTRIGRILLACLILCAMLSMLARLVFPPDITRILSMEAS